MYLHLIKGIFIMYETETHLSQTVLSIKYAIHRVSHEADCAVVFKS